MVAVLAQIDPLPRAQRQPAVTDGDGQAAAQQDGLHVGGHVVRPLDGVLVKGRVLRGQAVEGCFHVGPHGGVGVLVEGQRGRGVADEYMGQPDGKLTDLRHGGHYLVRDQMEAARSRGKRYLSLKPVHRLLNRDTYLSDKEFVMQSTFNFGWAGDLEEQFNRLNQIISGLFNRSPLAGDVQFRGQRDEHIAFALDDGGEKLLALHGLKWATHLYAVAVPNKIRS
ncbi:protein of unknown function [Candidatus Promineifilum breve]|uniref:Uncharacterized protein n=1 Tax=Candidatus Promineifilum breve TaxID=1806508 RepID=A0A160T6H7_9CHLR|nr:protein of unknown function [Candidatus Promineifilum breve]